MKTVGIIGGIGPESTIEYYRGIIAGYRKRQNDGASPSIIINSIDLTKLLSPITANDLDKATDLLVNAVQKLAHAGADFGAIAAGTPHIVFDEVRARSPIPLLSIVEAACEAAAKLKLKKIALFGTKFTMQARFYTDVFARAGIALIVPDENEQDYIHDKYMNDLVNGIILPETRERFLAIADAMKERNRVEGLILGGTELSLILRDSEHNGIPILDSTKIHVDSIVEKLRS